MMSLKPIAAAAVLAVLALPGAAQQPGAVEPQTTVPVEAQVALDSEEQKTLYALGLALSQSIGRLELQASELVFVVEGLEDGVLGETPRVPMEEYTAKVQQLAQARFAAAAEREAAASKELTARMAAEPGATKSESGIISFTLQEGTGATPAATDIVRVHYKGTLADGSVFDSSIDRGEPASFPLDQVIACWTEALQKVKVGGKVRIVCPPELAYGAQGRPGIPANAALIFEVELLGIGEEAAPAPGPGDSQGSTGGEELPQQSAAP
jgi:FKBP-type peptidyl-prolyl cis-trans isomerase